MELSAWGKLILDEITGDGEPNRPLYFYVDKEVLAEIGGFDNPIDALKDFQSAHNIGVGLAEPFSTHYLPFESLKRHGWSSPEFFRFVASLAMTVLAATDNPHKSPTAIYKRQRELLNIGGSGMVSNYDLDVRLMWKTWNRFLETDGSEFGTPTASPGYWANIGWALSQGLFRRRDRELISEWVDISELRGLEVENYEVLTQRLLQWLVTIGGRGSKLRAKMNDQGSIDLLGQLLQFEIKNSGAKTSKESREVAISAKIYFDGRDEQIGIYLSDETIASLAPECSTSTVTFLKNKFSKKLDIGFPLRVPVQNCEILLESGMRDTLIFDEATSLTVKMNAGKRSQYLLERQGSSGDYIEVTTTRMGSTYALVCRSSETVIAKKYISEVSATDTEFTNLDKGKAWVISNDFQLEIESENESSWIPQPTNTLTLKLTGGLKVGPNIYLTDGAPDVEYPELGNMALTLNDRELACEKDGGVVALNSVANAAGLYTVKMGSASRNFELVQSVNHSLVTSNYGYPMSKNETGHLELSRYTESVPADSIFLQGFDLSKKSSVMPHSTKVSFGKYVVLCANGSAWEVSSLLPLWLQHLGIVGMAQSISTSGLKQQLPRGSKLLIVIPMFPSIDQRIESIDLSSDSDEEVGLPRTTGNFKPLPDFLSQDVLNNLIRPTSMSEKYMAELARRHAIWSSENRTHMHLPTPRPQVGKLGKTVDTLQSCDDILIEWLSECNEGHASFEILDKTFSWIVERFKPLPNSNPKYIKETLEELGIIEIDRKNRRVFLTPATLLFPNNNGGYAMLTGSRPRKVLKELIEGKLTIDGIDDIFIQLVELTPKSNRNLKPTFIYMNWDIAESQKITDLMTTLGIRLASNVEDIILQSWPDVARLLEEDCELSLPPSPEIEKADITLNRVQWRRVKNDSAPGLYRYELFGSLKEHCYVSTDIRRLKVDLNTGKYLALSLGSDPKNPYVQVLRYSKSLRMLYLPGNFPLPTLISRALLAHSGNPSQVEEIHLQKWGTVQCITYTNVDENFAEDIARKLGQDLLIEETK